MTGFGSWDGARELCKRTCALKYKESPNEIERVAMVPGAHSLTLPPVSTFQHAPGGRFLAFPSESRFLVGLWHYLSKDVVLPVHERSTP